MRVSTTSVNGAFVPVLKAAPDGNLMIAYNHKVSSVNNPYYRQSTDGGVSWSAPTPIHASGSDLQEVTFAFDNSSVAHAVWRTGLDITYSRQNQWATNTSSTISSAGNKADGPEIAVAGNGDLHAVWAQSDTVNELQAIYHGFSQSGGASWTVTPLSTTSQRSSIPSVAVDQNGDVHVVWEERIFDSSCGGWFCYQIFYRKGDVSGSSITWDAANTLLSSGVSGGAAHAPTIIAAGNRLHVGYLREVSSSEQYAYYTEFVPGSGWSSPVDTTLGSPVIVNTNDPFYLITTLAICRGTVQLYYHGALYVNGREQVLGANKAGAWWPRDDVTFGSERAVNPSMTCLDDKLHVVFETVEASRANQVYYKNTVHALYVPIVYRQN